MYGVVMSLLLLRYGFWFTSGCAFHTLQVMFCLEGACFCFWLLYLQALSVFVQLVSCLHWSLCSSISTLSPQHSVCVCVIYVCVLFPVCATSYNSGQISKPVHCQNISTMLCLHLLLWKITKSLPAAWIILTLLSLSVSPLSLSLPYVLLLLTGLRLAEQLARREDEAKIRHRLGLSLWASGNLEEAQHQVKYLRCTGERQLRAVTVLVMYCRLQWASKCCHLSRQATYDLFNVVTSILVWERVCARSQ